MSMIFTIGAQTFGALTMAAGKYAMNIRLNAPRYKKDRFHVPGVNGNYIIRHGMSGRQITCTMAYVGKYADVLTSIAADRDLWGTAAVTIIDDSGASFVGCNLENYTRTGTPMGFRNPAGDEVWVIIEVEAIFEQDLLVNA